jgi:hypothetical protein
MIKHRMSDAPCLTMCQMVSVIFLKQGTKAEQQLFAAGY